MHPPRNSAKTPAWLPLAFVFLLFLSGAGGCKHRSHTSDSSLQKIDEMLDKQLPPGTPKPRVVYFLNSRGFRIERFPDKITIVALVRQIDTDTLQPATARATFHFDSTDKLISYDLQPGPDTPVQP
ncbi:MAG TPA: hypothetical protein VKH15_15690 [Candidatus Acidoferrum sp.]|nr:hypothetical protein [Candidatus Acidoferrum sp.]